MLNDARLLAIPVPAKRGFNSTKNVSLSRKINWTLNYSRPMLWTTCQRQSDFSENTCKREPRNIYCRSFFIVTCNNRIPCNILHIFLKSTEFFSFIKMRQIKSAYVEWCQTAGNMAGEWQYSKGRDHNMQVRRYAYLALSPLGGSRKIGHLLRPHCFKFRSSAVRSIFDWASWRVASWRGYGFSYDIPTEFFFHSGSNGRCPLT